MRKLCLIALSICFVFGSGIVVSGNEIDSVEIKEILQKDQVAKLADHYLEVFFSDGEDDLGTLDETISSKIAKEKEFLPDSEVKSIINLYGVDETVVAYFIPANDGYMIFDAKENGYGLLETLSSEEGLVEVLEKAQNERLYYIFPSLIVSKEELNRYIEESSISIEQIRMNQNMVPDEYEMSIGDYLETLDTIGVLNRNHEEVKIETDRQKFLPMWANGTEYYGGNQDWLYKDEDKTRGCGTVAAANIFAYMAMNHSGCRRLYSYQSINKSNFVGHLHEVLRFVRPTILGIPTPDFLATRMRAYAGARGINLVRTYPSSGGVEGLSNYVKSGLRQNVPVAYLQYFNPYYTYYNWHWMTITKYFRNVTQGDRHIATSSWGNRHSFNFQRLIRGSLVDQKGLMYFLKR